MHKKSGLLSELKRRRVFRTAVVYAVAAFVVAQVADLLLPALLLPEWTFRMVVALLILGFPIALALAWSFDLTAEGIRRTEGSGEAQVPGPSGEAAATEPLPPSSARRFAWFGGLGIGLGALMLGGYFLLGAPTHEQDQPPVSEAGYTIAVLPLTTLAGDEENEYFADGVTEDILTNLGLVPAFTVISRTSAMRYKGTDKSIPEIAAELGVRYVLEGSFRRADDRVRIVIQLVEPATDTQVWAQTLDHRIEDIFAMQSEVAQSVVDALRVELAGGLEERLARAPTEDFEAYELFLHGRDFYYQYSPPTMARAIELFQEAVERDPEFALAHAWLGSAHAVTYFNFGGAPSILERAEESSRHAVALQPDLGDGHRALGVALLAAGRLSEAGEPMERAIELNPNDFAAMGNLALVNALSGDWYGALDMTLASIRHDPVRSYQAFGNLASFYRILGMHAESAEAASQALALRFDERTAATTLAWIALLDGHLDEAGERAEALLDNAPGARGLADAAHILIRVGHEERGRQALEEAHARVPEALPVQYQAPGVVLGFLLDRSGESQRAGELLDASERLTREAIAQGNENPALRYSLASVAVIRGERDQALDHFERAVELGWNDVGFAVTDPILEPVRDDPRFTATVDRMRARVDRMRERVESQSWGVPVGPSRG